MPNRPVFTPPQGHHGIVTNAVSKNGFALRFATKALRGDPEIVMRALSHCGDALQFATKKLKGDRMTVMKAVSKHGSALRYVKEELRGDFEIVMEAVSECGCALQFAAEELKGDSEIVTKAVLSDGSALEYATKGLRDDEDMIWHALVRSQTRKQVVGLKIFLLSGRCCVEVFWRSYGSLDVMFGGMGVVLSLVSQGRCGCEIAQLRRLAAVVAASFLRCKPCDAHSSTPTPVFLTSREETQTMVRAKLRPKLRPPQTLYLPGKGETQTMV